MGQEGLLPLTLLVLCGGATVARAWGRPVCWLLAAGFVVLLAAASCPWPGGPARRRERERARRWLGLAALCAGVLLAGAARMTEWLTPRPCEVAFARWASSAALELTGAVATFPEQRADGGLSVVLTVDNIDGDAGPAGARLSLVVTPGCVDSSSLVPGAMVRVSGRYYPPRPAANPGEPDMRVILGRQRLSGTIYVSSPGALRALGAARQGIVARVATALRRRMTEVSHATLPPRQAAILCGMLFGSPPPEIEDSLQATGTAHLFAVSGLHVGFVAALLGSALSLLRLPALARALMAVSCVWLYAFACGLGPSVTRAALMFSFLVCARLAGRKTRAEDALCLSGIVMEVLNPASAFDPGAQLSFAVVLAVLHLAPRIERSLLRLPRGLAKSLAPSMAAQIGAAPLVAWYFGRVAPIGVLANVPCVALAGIGVTIGFSAGLAGLIWPQLASALNAANSFVLAALEGSLDLLARAPFGSTAVARPHALWMAAWYASLLVVACLPRRVVRGIRASGSSVSIFLAAGAAAAVWIAVLRPAPLEVVFLSVGQGDSVFIRSPSGRTVLVDGGGAPDDRRDPGAEVVLPYLLRRGVRRLDLVVATHPHLDHIGGLMAILRSCRVGALAKPSLGEAARPAIDAELVRAATERGTQVLEMARGGHVDLGDGARMVVLHPPREPQVGRDGGLNALSLVARLTYGGFAMLLTGDAGGEVLSGLAADLEGEGCAVLKVPHHGAAATCPEEALRAISASWAVVSVGPNAFGHPADSTVAALERAGAQVLRTDADGAVIVRSNGRRVRVRSMLGGQEGWAVLPAHREECAAGS